MNSELRFADNFAYTRERRLEATTALRACTLGLLKYGVTCNMDLIDQIKKLAGDAFDQALQTVDTRRIGAEAERRGLFAAWMRNASNETVTELLRERDALFSRIGDDEMTAEFERRCLLSDASFAAGFEKAFGEQSRVLHQERERVKGLVASLKRHIAAADVDLERL